MCVYPRLDDTSQWEYIGTWNRIYRSSSDQPPRGPVLNPYEDEREGHRLLAVNPKTGEVYRSTTLADPFHRVFPEGIPSRGPVARDVIGDDNRVWVGNTEIFPFNTIVAMMEQLGMDMNNQPIFEPDNHGCSGAFIGPRHVMTAAHCVAGLAEPDFPSENDVFPHAVIRGRNGPPGQEIGDAAPNGVADPEIYFVPEGWTNSGLDDRFDYAILVLDCDDESPNWLGFAARSKFEIESEFRTITGYPGAAFQCEDSPFSDEQCSEYLKLGEPWPASCCGSFMYTEDCGVSVGPNTIVHGCDTVSGQSGAPHYGNFNGELQAFGNYMESPNPLANVTRRMREPSFDEICSAIGNTPSSNFDHDCF